VYLCFLVALFARSKQHEAELVFPGNRMPESPGD